jgi:Tol biopolymer transport system component
LAPAGLPEALPFGDQATGLDVARSGRLVYSSRFRDSGLWQLDLTRPTRGLRDIRLLDTRFDEHTPHYSPDGTRLAFASTRTGTEEIWIANADGSDPRQMTSMGGTMCANPQWSPDGQQIVFSSAKAGSLDLYLLNPSTAELRQLTSAPGWEDLPRWSRDGAWIYFSARAPGEEMAEIWKMPAAGGSPQQVTTGGGDVASESHDGSVLFFARSSARLAALWRMPLTGGRPTLMADGLVGTLNFAVGRRAVYFVSSAGRPGDNTIDEIDIASGKRLTLAGFGRRWWGVALSPDERTLIVSAINDQGLDLMLVEPAR